MRLKIEKMGINGEGIAYYQKKPVFIEGALPQELVEIKDLQGYGTYYKARIEKIVKESRDRIRPACAFAHRCRACSMMHLAYEKQLKAKRDILAQTLMKYAKIEPSRIEEIIANEQPLHYRNQCKLPLQMEQGKLCSGMYLPGSNYFASVKNCVIHDPLIETVRKEVLHILNKHGIKAYDYHKKSGMRSLIIRTFQGKCQVTLVSGEDVLTQELIADLLDCEAIVSLWQSINTVKKSVDVFGKKMIFLGGAKQLRFLFGGYRMQINPRSFFQLNTKQAEVLYQKAASLLTGKRYGTIVEAYSGIGAISLFLHGHADQVIGIESIADAVQNAHAIASLNHIDNVKFVCGDAAEELTYLSKKGKIDLLVVDPPRSGLDYAMLGTLLQSKIQEIIYISCNTATLGKNLDLLQQRYEVKTIIPIDLFSQTAAIEAIVHLKRKR